ncbi:uncharacterized protein LOC143216973 [Lasioglossum baleicum]|uniref:uncharacterized protein LOC143216973 n=1 Tax=Lasioglossum baleicum TaxID=434251 RepID=UPI003FCC3DBF
MSMVYGAHYDKQARRSSLTIMRASALICWILVFILTTDGLHTRHQLDDEETRRNLDGLIEEYSGPRLLRSPWMTVTLKDKRNDELEKETLPTRHAKHRKRRRCRNRSICSRGIARPFRNETKNDREANTVLENEEHVADANDQTQEVNSESKGEDYDARDPEEKASFNVERNVSSESMDSFDDRSLLDEIEFQDTSLPSWAEDWSKKDRLNETDNYGDETARRSAVEDQTAFHEGLGVLLGRLFQSLRNASGVEGRDILKELNFVNGSSEDPCQKWLNSRDKLEKVFLGGLASLPACPCQYPSNIFYDDKIWDEPQRRHFRWRDVSGSSQRLDVYKPGAAYCVRSLLIQGSGSAAAQHCCYDRRRKLLTRGSGAGTPNFVSPEISAILHERIDVLPWRLCKGDFSRYNGVRPPNNDNSCDPNPDDEEYQRQIDNTKYY